MSDDDTQAHEPETTDLPTTAAPTPELAWSLDDEPEPQRQVATQPWRTTLGLVGIIAACSAALAIAAGGSLWAMQSETVPPLPVIAQPTTTVQPIPTTPRCAPGHNADKGCPPVVVTTTTTTPQDRDARFVALVHDNLPAVFNDRPVESAQNLCRELATEGTTKQADIAYLVTLPNVTVEQATYWWDLATSTYCPQYH